MYNSTSVADKFVLALKSITGEGFAQKGITLHDEEIQSNDSSDMSHGSESDDDDDDDDYDDEADEDPCVDVGKYLSVLPISDCSYILKVNTTPLQIIHLLHLEVEFILAVMSLQQNLLRNARHDDCMLMLTQTHNCLGLQWHILNFILVTVRQYVNDHH